jgi:hypothetical protein
MSSSAHKGTIHFLKRLFDAALIKLASRMSLFHKVYALFIKYVSNA